MLLPNWKKISANFSWNNEKLPKRNFRCHLPSKRSLNWPIFCIVKCQLTTAVRVTSNVRRGVALRRVGVGCGLSINAVDTCTVNRQNGRCAAAAAWKSQRCKNAPSLHALPALDATLIVPAIWLIVRLSRFYIPHRCRCRRTHEADIIVVLPGLANGL